MGRKRWLSAVKKAVFSSYSKDKKDKRSHPNVSSSCQGNQISFHTYTQPTAAAAMDNPPMPMPMPIKDTQPQNEQQQLKQPTPMPEEAAQVNRVTSTTPFLDEFTLEKAAIKIQKAYRGYLARRGLRGLRARRRLKKLIRGQAVKRQSESTLRCMQTIARVQSQVRARRIRMSQVNQALRRQLLEKCEKELKLKSSQQQGSGWDLSPKSKKQVEASLQRKKGAAERRERALAYSHTHQQTWRKSLKKSGKSTSMEPNYLEWGWSWSERWDAARPWEPGTTSTIKTNMRSSHSSPVKASLSGRGESLRSASLKDDDSKSYASSSVGPRSYKTSIKSIKVSNPGPNPLKKGGPNTNSNRNRVRVQVGSTKKQLVSRS